MKRKKHFGTTVFLQFLIIQYLWTLQHYILALKVAEIFILTATLYDSALQKNETSF
jgi:hypothetical protein